MWIVGWSGWSQGQEGELGSGLRLLGARAVGKGGQVLGVVRVVSGLRGRIGKWAEAAWCEGSWEREASAWGGQGGLGAERANWGVGSGCLVRGQLRKGGKCLGVSGWSRGREGELGSGLRLFGARAVEKGGQVLGDCSMDSGVVRVVSGPRG